MKSHGKLKTKKSKKDPGKARNKNKAIYKIHYRRINMEINSNI